MKTLLLMRHAKSSWSEEGLPDHDRPLNGRGKRDAPRMGKLLLERGLVPDYVVSSTAKRARKTAERVAEVCGYEGKIHRTEDLYHASPGEWIEVLNRTPETARRILGVAHNPGIEDFLGRLIGESATMPTAALAQIALPIERWAELTGETKGELLGFWTPKDLD